MGEQYPRKPDGAGGEFRDRGDLPGVPGPAAVARGFPLPALRPRPVLASPWSFAGVRGLWLPNFGDSGDYLLGHADAIADLVPRHVVGDHAEERRQRAGSATGTRAEELRDSLGLAAQIQARHGAAGGANC